MCLITVGFNCRKEVRMLPSAGFIQMPNRSPSPAFPSCHPLKGKGVLEALKSFGGISGMSSLLADPTEQV